MKTSFSNDNLIIRLDHDDLESPVGHQWIDSIMTLVLLLSLGYMLFGCEPAPHQDPVKRVYSGYGQYQEFVERNK